MTQDVVFLGDKTLSLLTRNLNSELQRIGSRWHAVDSGYDTWLVAPLDSGSMLFRKDTAAWAFLLSPRVLEYVPDIEKQVEATLARLAGLATPPTVLFSSVFSDPISPMPLSSNLARQARAARINERLLGFREAHPWFHVVDHVGLALQHGVNNLHDPRFEANAQLYYSPTGTRHLTVLWLRALRALERPQKKVCVVDLDNTLWGGILGEDGAEGIQMADAGAGWAYRRFQRSLLELRRNGVLLAVCSKNNSAEALEVLQSHPDCLLRPKDFAHIEIGWGLKSEALTRTAEKLSLGLDSFVFIDDSAQERDEVARVLPSVDVFPFPEDAHRLSSILSEFPGFDVLRQTDEDLKRADAYQEEAQRKASQQDAASPEEFYRSLDLRLDIFTARMEQAARLHQLLLKTNQFNLTTQRLSPEEFRNLLSNPGYAVLGLRVADRFGDSGITGLAIVDKRDPGHWFVDNFLLSCRVIGRTVENAFVAWLLETARTANAKEVLLRFAPSKRNEVARNFLQASGGAAVDAGSAWRFDVTRPDVLPQHFVRIDDTQVA